jgi:hypothetical protein
MVWRALPGAVNFTCELSSSSGTWCTCPVAQVPTILTLSSHSPPTILTPSVNHPLTNQTQFCGSMRASYRHLNRPERHLPIHLIMG